MTWNYRLVRRVTVTHTHHERKYTHEKSRNTLASHFVAARSRLRKQREQRSSYSKQLRLSGERSRLSPKGSRLA